MFELNDENRQSVLDALTNEGFKVLSKEEDSQYKQSYETLKKGEIKEIWDKIDSTIFEMTGIEKLIRDDNGRERTVDYYQRALKETLEGKKNASKELDNYKKTLDEVQSQYEALKSDNPEAKYEEKFKELKAQMKKLEDDKANALSQKEQEFNRMLFDRELDAVLNNLRPQLKNDVPYLERIISETKRTITGLESKTQDDKTVFYKNGSPMLNEDGSFMTLNDIAKGELISLFDDTKIKQGIGGNTQKANTNIKQFNNVQELDAYLKEKHGSAFGSQDWAKERAELKAANGL